MADLIQRTRFERPSFPQQSAYTLFVPLGLVNRDFVAPAVRQLHESFVAATKYELKQQLLTQPEFSWLFVPVGLVDLNIVTPAVSQLRESFIADPAKLLIQQLLAQPQVNQYFFKASVDVILSTFLPIFKQQESSFRAAPHEQLSYSQHLTQPLFTPWLRDPLELPNALLPIFVAEGLIG